MVLYDLNRFPMTSLGSLAFLYLAISVKLKKSCVCTFLREIDDHSTESASVGVVIETNYQNTFQKLRITTEENKKK